MALCRSTFPQTLAQVVAELAKFFNAGDYAGLLCEWWKRKLCISQFRKRKYAMANGFREIA